MCPSFVVGDSPPNFDGGGNTIPIDVYLPDCPDTDLTVDVWSGQNKEPNSVFFLQLICFRLLRLNRVSEWYRNDGEI